MSIDVTIARAQRLRMQALLRKTKSLIEGDIVVDKHGMSFLAGSLSCEMRANAEAPTFGHVSKRLRLRVSLYRQGVADLLLSSAKDCRPTVL